MGMQRASCETWFLRGVFIFTYLDWRVVVIQQKPSPWSWGLSNQVMVWWVRMKCLPSHHISGVCWCHFHRLHALPQRHILDYGEVGTFPSVKAFYKSPQCLLAEHITCSSTHVALTDERAESPAQVQRLLCVIFRQSVAEILNDHKRVIVRFQEPVRFIKVVLMDVLESTNGFPVQVFPPLAHVQLHSGEVRLDGAHVQHFVAALGPSFSDVLGSGLQVLWSRHDPT